MKRIQLTDRAKAILRLAADDSYEPNENDRNDLYLLEEEGLGDVCDTKDGIAGFDISDFGLAYLQNNPRLKNPSIWRDKKFWIRTILSIIGILVTIWLSC